MPRETDERRPNQPDDVSTLAWDIATGIVTYYSRLIDAQFNLGHQIEMAEYLDRALTKAGLNRDLILSTAKADAEDCAARLAAVEAERDAAHPRLWDCAICDGPVSAVPVAEGLVCCSQECARGYHDREAARRAEYAAMWPEGLLYYIVTWRECGCCSGSTPVCKGDDELRMWTSWADGERASKCAKEDLHRLQATRCAEHAPPATHTCARCLKPGAAVAEPRMSAPELRWWHPECLAKFEAWLAAQEEAPSPASDARQEQRLNDLRSAPEE